METDKKRRLLPTILATAILTLGIGGGCGYAIGTLTHSLSDDEQKIVDEYRLLKNEWLYGNEEEYLSELGAKGLASAIAESKADPYTFYTSTQAEQGLSTDGNGFGFSSHYYDGGLYVVSVFSDSPAAKAGLREKDVLYSVKVGNQEVYNFKDHGLTEINAKLSSVNDTTTHFVFSGKRDGEDIIVDMTRDRYEEDVVSILESGKDTLMVKINTFLGTPSLALKGTIDGYQKDHTLKTLILDLRGNGGGYVSQADAMAKLFVKKNTLIYQLRDKNNKVQEQSIQSKDPVYDIPDIKIIMDQNTASASEIFTLAMRAGTNTTTYGFKSYGKGIAQNFHTFSDGSVIRYTYAYVYGPEKENETIPEEANDNDDVMCIHQKGITPDVTFPVDYSFLYSSMDFSSIGISEYGQNYFLRVLNFLYPGSYPTSYSKDYHFVDAIQSYGNAMVEKYSNASLKDAFNEQGGMSKALNDILNKEEYDAYLANYDALTASVSGESK